MEIKNLFEIKNKVIVITGGTGVLGACISEYFAEQNAKVVVLARNQEKGEALATKIKAKGQECMFLSTDVNNVALLEQNAREITEHYGRVDVLINAAGGNMSGATIAPDQSILQLDTEAFRQVMDLNLLGTVIPTQVFTKIMVQQQTGSIINFSSESALRPLTRVVGYGAAKAAVTNFTRYMATEMAQKFGNGFRVNAVAPGFFLTEQNRSLLTNPDGSLTQRGKTIIDHTPFGRFGKPEELLGALHWLASDASRFVTGTVVVVDGGFDAFCI